MIFDHPRALWLLAALAPIAAAFFFGRRRPRVTVPDLEAWLAAAAPQHASRGLRTLKNAASLLLNLAAAAALALAAAGPRPARPAGTDWAIVVDTSYSMQARDGRWKGSRAIAEAFVSRLGPEDRFRVLEAGEVPRAVGGWREAGQPLPPWDPPNEISGDIEGALAMAKEGSRPGVLRTIVFSDREARADFAPRVATPGENLAVEGLNWRRAWASPKVDIVVHVANRGATKRSTTLTVTCGKARAELPVTDLAAGQSATLRTTLDAPDGGPLEARIPPTDALALDDAAFAPVPPLRHPRVVVAAPDERSPWVASALLSLAPALDASSGIAPPGTDADADFAIWDRTGPAASPRGAALFIAPDSPFCPAVPGAPVENPAVGACATDHPLFRDLDLTRLRVARARPFARAPGQTVLIDSAAGPLAVTGTSGGLKFVALAFALDDSNLPLLAAFPLFIRNAVETLTRLEPMPQARVGEVVEPFEGKYDVAFRGETRETKGPWRAPVPGVAVFTRGSDTIPLGISFDRPEESTFRAPPTGKELPEGKREEVPWWIALVAGAAVGLVVDWGVVGRRASNG